MGLRTHGTTDFWNARHRFQRVLIIRRSTAQGVPDAQWMSRMRSPTLARANGECGDDIGAPRVSILQSFAVTRHAL